MTKFRIVKRAYGRYSDIETFEGKRLDAVEYSAKMQFERRDGEYLVRGMDEPNWSPSSSYQSGMDWL